MKSPKYWYGLLAISLVLTAWGWFRDDAFRATREIVYPFENAVHWARRVVVAPVRGLFNRADLAARNDELSAEIERLRADAIRLEGIAAENRQLRAALTFPPPSGRRLVSCSVLSLGGTTGWQRMIRIGKGARDGIRPGDPALAPDGLVGRVERTSTHTADVLLISDPNCHISCELDPPPSGVGVVRGLLCGGGGRPAGEGELSLIYVIDPLRLRFVKRDIEPAPRTRIVTSGLGGVFPQGIPVGYILGSTTDPNGLYREAEVIPAADLGGLRVVLVLTQAPETTP